MSDLKKKYEKKTINQIEKEIKTNNSLSIEARKNSILALMYLRDSKRYKENPLYRKSSFENYLMGFYNIKIGTFLESARAFNKHPKESVKYGVGLVSKIGRVCGAVKEKTVLKEINDADKKAKIPLKRDKIESIIQKYAKLKPPAKPGYKELYVNEMKRHQITKDRYNETIKELKAAKEQIEKLKVTILSFREVVEELETA